MGRFHRTDHWLLIGQGNHPLLWFEGNKTRKLQTSMLTSSATMQNVDPAAHQCTFETGPYQLAPSDRPLGLGTINKHIKPVAAS